MRTVCALALLLTAPALAAPAAAPRAEQQEDEAEKAFRAMEQRLLAAKTLRFAFAMTIEVDTREDKLKGTVTLGEANRASINVNGTMSGKPLEMLMVSDGAKMVAKVVGSPTQGPRDTPRGAGALILGTVARAGVFAGLFYSVNDKKEPELDDLFQVTDVKIGARQKIAGKDVLVLEYVIGFRGAKEKGRVTLWVESKSHLPLKRVFTINDASHKVRVMEVYEGTEIDAKVDDKVFELPK